MPTIDSTIITLLENSSLPAFYKAILRNILSSLSQIQKGDLYITLMNERDKRKEIEEKGEEICRYYDMIASKLEKDPDGLLDRINYTEKGAKIGQTKGTSKTKLSSIKDKLDLQALKKQVEEGEV